MIPPPYPFPDEWQEVARIQHQQPENSCWLVPRYTQHYTSRQVNESFHNPQDNRLSLLTEEKNSQEHDPYSTEQEKSPGCNGFYHLMNGTESGTFATAHNSNSIGTVLNNDDGVDDDVELQFNEAWAARFSKTICKMKKKAHKVKAMRKTSQAKKCYKSNGNVSNRNT